MTCKALVSDQFESYSLSLLRKPTKKQKTTHYTPVLIGEMNSRHGKAKWLNSLKILLDSGTSSSILLGKYAEKLRRHQTKPVRWETQAGVFHTKYRANIEFAIPELDATKSVTWQFHVDDSPGAHRYDMILGRDIMDKLDLDICFSDNTIKCTKEGAAFEGCTAPMKDLATISPNASSDWLHDETFCHEESWESDHVLDATQRTRHILDATYKKADLRQVVNDNKHLTDEERDALHSLLVKYEFLFDGTLGHWNTRPVDIELQDDAKPYHAKPYPVPRAYEAVFKKEVARLCKLGVLKKVNRSEWAAPTFIQPKKNGTVRFLSDFRKLNQRIKRKPFPLPKIQDMLLRLEGFTHASSLDLNMGYYHIELSPSAKQLCTIVLPWGKYEYQKLPMGVCNSPDIFQEKISELFEGFDNVRAYIDDILVINKGDFADHLQALEKVLQRLAEAGLKVNADKSFFGRSETEYLGFWVSRNGIRPLASKVEAIKAISPPTKVREIRRFVGLINYYRDMWRHRAHILAPLTKLCSTKTKFKWSSVEQNAFEAIKKIVGRDVLLSYPDFTKEFVIHTDASKAQLGGVISQSGKPIAFYSRKLTPAQINYTTTERELLSIVETLKEFRTILLGQKIRVYTDHKNLTFENFTTERVLRWRLLLEEYGPVIEYVKGIHNDAADALSRLPLIDSAESESKITKEMLSESYSVDKLDADTFPLTYRMIDKYQRKDKNLIAKLKSATYHTKSFRGGGKVTDLICKGDKIVLPTILQKYAVNWYHTYLLHPGMERTEATLCQHYYWPESRDTIRAHIKKCTTCQKNKKINKKYGYLPAKEAEAIPWDRLSVDLIGPYKIKREGHDEPLVLKALTMIDPATGWFEIVQYSDKTAANIANLVEQTWLSRYPRPTIITYDKGNEFLGHAFKNELIQKEYGIKAKCATTANPQANSILERIHQVIANLVRTFDLQNNYLDKEDPWAGILAATAFAVRSTYHTTLQATPGQLVFGRDMILNTPFIADWEAIRRRKQELIDKNNKNENAKRIPYTYRVRQQVLVRNKRANKYETPYIGPYPITKVWTNGNVTIRKGPVQERINIRWIKPYHT